MGLIDDSALWALGLLDLGRGDPASALARLRGIRHPVVLVFSSLERVEAAWQAGDRDAARTWPSELEQLAWATRQPWALARAAHGKALLADDTAPEQAFTEALLMLTARVETPDRVAGGRGRRRLAAQTIAGGVWGARSRAWVADQR